MKINRKLIISLMVMLLLVAFSAVMSFAEIVQNASIQENSDGSYTISVTARESTGATLSYQWYECDVSGANASPISGAGSSVFQAPKDENQRYYYCMIEAESLEAPDSIATKVVTVPAYEEKKPDVDIMTFAIEGIDEPETGKAPDTYAVTTGSGGAGFKITGIKWSPEVDSYLPASEYTVTVTVKIEEGYQAGKGFKCIIDGKNASVISNSGDTVVFSYTFPATEAAAITDDDDKDSGEDVMVNGADGDGLDDYPEPLGISLGTWFKLILLIAVIVATVLIVRGVKRRRKADRDYLSGLKEEKENEDDINEINRLRAIERSNVARNAQQGLDSISEAASGEYADEYEEETSRLQGFAAKIKGKGLRGIKGVANKIASAAEKAEEGAAAAPLQTDTKSFESLQEKAETEGNYSEPAPEKAQTERRTIAIPRKELEKKAAELEKEAEGGEKYTEYDFNSDISFYDDSENSNNFY